MSEKGTKRISVEIPKELYDVLDYRCNLPLSPTKQEFVTKAIYTQLSLCPLVHDLLMKTVNENDL